MKGETGNLILVLREGASLIVDGPAEIKVKQIKRNKIVVMVNADDDTNVSRNQEDVKDSTHE